LGLWIRLGACKTSSAAPKCKENYAAWLDAGCLCDHDRYPRLWLPKGTTPIGFVYTLMELGWDYDEIARRNRCLETSADCSAARDGALRLNRYGQNVPSQAVEVMVGGKWMRAVGEINAAAAQAVCGLLGCTSGEIGGPLDALPWYRTRMAYLEPSSSYAQLVAPAPKHTDRHSKPTADVPVVVPLEPPAIVASGHQTVRPVTVDCADPAESTKSRHATAESAAVRGCFVAQDGVRQCEIDGAEVDVAPTGVLASAREATAPTWPTMACGTLSTRFLDPGAARADADGSGDDGDGGGARVSSCYSRCGLGLVSAAALALAAVLLVQNDLANAHGGESSLETAPASPSGSDAGGRIFAAVSATDGGDAVSARATAAQY
jgi:hypothetical protein